MAKLNNVEIHFKHSNRTYNTMTAFLVMRQLDEMVSDIAARLPCCGIRSMQSMLRANGFTLQRERVRDSLHRVDPVGMLVEFLSI